MSPRAVQTSVVVQLTALEGLFFAWTVESHLCVYGLILIFTGSQYSMQIYRVLLLGGIGGRRRRG